MTYDEFTSYCKDNLISIDCHDLADRQEVRDFLLSLDPEANVYYLSEEFSTEAFPYAAPSTLGNPWWALHKNPQKAVWSIEQFRAEIRAMTGEDDEMTSPDLEDVL